MTFSTALLVIMLSVIMLTAIMLGVAFLYCYAECRAKSHHETRRVNAPLEKKYQFWQMASFSFVKLQKHYN
jgi:hypothetical protein